MKTEDGRIITRLKTIRLDFISVSLMSDGFMMLEVEADKQVEIPHVKQIVEAMKELGGGEKYPLLILAEPNTLPTMETRAYMASKESNPYASAEAYVITSLGQKVAGNLYLSFNKPQRPTQIFTERNKAIRWLKNFL